MNRPAAVEITYGCMKFLITHNPTDATLNKFTEVRMRARAAQLSYMPSTFTSLLLVVRSWRNSTLTHWWESAMPPMTRPQ